MSVKSGPTGSFLKILYFQSVDYETDLFYAKY